METQDGVHGGKLDASRGVRRNPRRTSVRPTIRLHHNLLDTGDPSPAGRELLRGGELRPVDLRVGRPRFWPLTRWQCLPFKIVFVFCRLGDRASCAVAACNDKLFITGGRDDRNQVISSVMCWDAAAGGVLTEECVLPLGVSHHGSVTLMKSYTHIHRIPPATPASPPTPAAAAAPP
ncbi:unnamed protein product [Boreogadus saida]